MKKLTILFLASLITLLFTACSNREAEHTEYKTLACKRLVDLSPNEVTRASELMLEKRDRDQKAMANMNQDQLEQFMLKDKEDMNCK